MNTATNLLGSTNALLQRHVFSEYLRKWVFLSVLIGIAGGVGAIAFYLAIDLATELFLGQLASYEPPLTAGEGNGETLVTDVGRKWALPLVVALGGLLSGLIVYMLAPEAEGGGADAAIDAFHQKGGRVRGRIPLVKLLASAITIGSGGSAGREGPLAQVAAGIGSWVGSAFNLSAADRRAALAVGVAAGIGAIFKAPLGAAILAVEILYLRDLELETLVPAFIASVIGYTVFGAYAGWEPVFGQGLGLQFRDPETLLGFVVLGIACGLGGIAYVKTFYGVQGVFRKIPIPRHIKPALAGLMVGGIALFYPQVLSMGYGWIQLAIDGNTEALAASTMLVLVFLKIVATSLTVGSGGSGGVFAPGLFIGGMLGGALHGLLDGMPFMPDTPGPFVIVGMAALFGGVAKAPIAVILMVAEMTNEFSMLIPAMLTVTVAYLVAHDAHIYLSQVPTRADSPAHRSEYIVPLTQAVSVADAMRTQVITTTPSSTIAEAEECMREHGLRGLPVIENGKLAGIFTITDALRAAHAGTRLVGEAMTRNVHVAYPADSLHTALQRMSEIGVSRLPVVRREDEERLLGIITTRDIARGLDSQLAVIQSAPKPEPAAGDPFGSLPVTEAMSREMTPYGLDTPVRTIFDELSAQNLYAAMIVNEDGYLAGLTTLGDLERALSQDVDATAKDAMTSPVVVARETQTLAEAFAQPGAEVARQLPVVTGRAGRLRPVGMLRRSDVMSALLRARDRQATISRRLLQRAGLQGDDLTTIDASVQAGDGLAGRSLAELDLPQDAVITSLIREGRPIIPRGRLILHEGDEIQVTTTIASRDLVLHRLTARRSEEQVP